MCFEYSRCAIGVRGMLKACMWCAPGVSMVSAWGVMALCVVISNGGVTCVIWQFMGCATRMQVMCETCESGVRGRYWCATACELRLCDMREERLF
jgi:hypothetical protein